MMPIPDINCRKVLLTCLFLSSITTVVTTVAVVSNATTVEMFTIYFHTALPQLQTMEEQFSLVFFR